MNENNGGTPSNLYTPMNELERLEPHKDQKKSNKGKNIIIIVLVLIIIGLGGYLIYDKFIKEKPKEEATATKQEEVKKEPKENLTDIATSLIGKISTYNVDQLDAYELNATYSTTPTNEQLKAMMDYFWKIKPDERNSYSKSEIDNYLSTVYGIIPTSYPNINCYIDNEPYYIYDNAKQAYVWNAGTTGHAHCRDDIKALAIKTVDIKKEKDNYILTTNKIFTGPIMSTDGVFYSDGKMEHEIISLEKFVDQTTGVGDEEVAKKYFNDNYEMFKNQKPYYKYTFKKSGDNYYLIAYEVIK